MSRRAISLFALAFLWLFAGAPARVAVAEPALDEIIVAADAVIASGASPSAVTRALVRRAEARRLSGKLALALEDLARAQSLAPTEPERAYALVAYGTALMQANRGAAAKQAMADALSLLGPHPNPALDALASATLARLNQPTGTNPAFEADQLATAQRWAGRAIAAAQVAGSPILLATASLAAAQVELAAQGPDADRAATHHMQATLQSLRAIPASLAGGQLALQTAQSAIAQQKPDIAMEALAIAAESPHKRIAAAASVQQAGLELDAGRFATAELLAAEGLRAAQHIGDDELAFRAAWRLGEVAAEAGAFDQALPHFRLAFASLKRARGDASGSADAGQSLFRRSFGNFHHAFFKVLLHLQDRTGEATFLAEARSVIEDLKADEVEDYFQERCVPRNAGSVSASRAGEGVAVLYPVVLDDRLELLVEIGDRLVRHSIPIAGPTLEALARGYRRDIENQRRDFSRRGQQLYAVLIAPIEQDLTANDIRTLVYAPDAALRLVPLASVWDGKRFLAQRFAIATVLGLTFLPPDSGIPGQSLALAAGADAVPGYAPLPSVSRELDGVVSHLHAERLFQSDFSQAKFAAALQTQPYDVIHVASHAEVGPKPEDNFIAAIDGPIDMNQLALSLRARSLATARPLELLTLSACSTAGGDDQAPLGLAGIAFRAGARSVVASLWPVRDGATAAMMDDLYTSLAEGTPRGKALAQAQTRMIEAGGAIADPSIWGAFLAIGDWR